MTIFKETSKWIVTTTLFNDQLYIIKVNVQYLIYDSLPDHFVHFTKTFRHVHFTNPTYSTFL